MKKESDALTTGYLAALAKLKAEYKAEADLLKAEHKAILKAEYKGAVKEKLREERFGAKALKVIELREKNPCFTGQQIADVVGLSRERVRQILSKQGLRTKSTKWKAHVCRHCGKHFSGNRFYCSPECRRQGINKYHGSITVVCAVCGKQRIKRKSEILRSTTDFCSKECRNEYGRSVGWEGSGRPPLPLIEIICDVCGKVAYHRPSQVSKYRGHMCSAHCRSIYAVRCREAGRLRKEVNRAYFCDTPDRKGVLPSLTPEQGPGPGANLDRRKERKGKMNMNICRTRGRKVFSFRLCPGGFWMVINFIPGFWGVHLGFWDS